MNQDLTAETEYSQCCQRYLEELVARRDFRAAIRYFESVHRAFRGKTDPESGILMRLGAKAYTAGGEPGKALPLIRTAIETLSGVTDKQSEKAESYMVLGDTLRELGEFNEAERAFHDAESIYRRDDNLDGAGDALNRLAGIFYRKGDFANSLRCLLDAIEFARKENDRKKLGYLFGNIGRIYTFLGEFSRAEENIKFNIELSCELDDNLELARAQLSLGYLFLQMRRFQAAETELNKAYEIIADNNYEKERVIYLTYLGELAARIGDYAAAVKYLEDASGRGRQVSPDSLLAVRPNRWLAETFLLRKNYRKALQLAGQTLIAMKKLNNAIEIGALQRIRAVCLENLQKSNQAQNEFLESIRILEKCGARHELADTLAEAGKSSLFNVNQCTMYLCRAEELFAGCSMTSEAHEIESAITGINLESEVDADNISANKNPLNSFITKSAKMKDIISKLQLLRDSDLPVLLTGETGTGKDHLARYFHSITRPDGPYVAVNCAAIPENLIESELFGYDKGAFTGADGHKDGLFKSANHGILLLDEVGELPLTLQAKLLSVIETKKLRPLGTAAEFELDIRIVAATNRDLAQMVEAGKFRQDLYYRLAGITLELPPLRERKEDIPLLLEHFMREFGLLRDGQNPGGDLVQWFVAFDWPGNVRQLENKVKQLAAVATMSEEESLTEIARGFFETKSREKTDSLFEQVENFERKLLLEALIASGGNKSQAARMLSIHESTFRAKMKRYSLDAIAN